MDITNLKKQRKKVGLTQKEVAEQAQITRRHYLRIEKGTCNPNANTACLIAKTLKSTVEELFPIQSIQKNTDDNKKDSTNM